jgi:hypothetical protein
MRGSDGGLREDLSVVKYDSLEFTKYILTILRVFLPHFQDLSSKG